MTRSEKRKIKYEALLKKEAEKEQICATIETIKNTCEDCEFCKKFNATLTESEPRDKWVCAKKARQEMIISKDEYTGEIKSLKIGFYPYGMVNGKCINFVYMRMMDDK